VGRSFVIEVHFFAKKKTMCEYDYIVVIMKYGLILWVSQTRLTTNESVLHLLIVVGTKFRMMRLNMDGNV